MLLRPAHPADALAVARVHVRSWQAAYKGLMPAGYLDQLRPEDRAARYDFATTDPSKPHTIVAEDNSEILGFVTTGPTRSEDLPGYGELFALYIDPNHWNKKIGLALIEAGRARMLESGFRSACLWLLVGNVRAERFYLKDGWAADGVSKRDEIWGVEVNDTRFRREL
jgi:GNAT superfamily N-acetyltransferase